MPYLGASPDSVRNGKINYLINGDMMIDQRLEGAAYDAGDNNDDVYTLDQWIILSESNDGVDVSRDTTVPSSGAINSIKLDLEIANEMFGICQIIENKNCRDIIGQEVTLSFQAKVSNARIGDIRAYILAWDGTADSVTSDVVATWNDDANPTFATNWTAENTGADLGVGTSFAKFSVTGTIDTSSTANVAVFIACVDDSVSAGDILYVTDVQLELGNNASIFDRKTYQQQNLDCQRYLLKLGSSVNDSSDYHLVGIGRGHNATTIQQYIKPPIEMRVIPSISIGGTIEKSNSDGQGDVSGVAIGTGSFGSTTTDLMLQWTVASGAVVDEATVLRGKNAGGDFVLITAEL